MQDYNTIIGAIQMRLNKCPTRSVASLDFSSWLEKMGMEIATSWC